MSAVVLSLVIAVVMVRFWRALLRILATAVVMLAVLGAIHVVQALTAPGN